MISNTVSFRVVLCGGTDLNIKSRATMKAKGTVLQLSGPAVIVSIIRSKFKVRALYRGVV